MKLRVQSFKQAAFWSTAIGALGQGLSLLFGMLMAAYFGAQDSTDVLYYCLGTFALLSALVQQVNVFVLIPETMRRREQVGDNDAMAFINRFFLFFCALILGVTALILVHPAGVLTAISRFSAEMLEANRTLVLWLAISFPLQMIAQLLLDVLVSYRFLSLPVVLSSVSRIINLAFVLAFHRRLGVVSAAMGMAAGFGLQIVVNGWLLRSVVRWKPWAWKTRIGAAVFQNMFWAELGTVAMALASYLPLYLFSGFSAGAMTALNYAQRMSRMPTDVLTTQFSSVAAVKFNELTARRQEDELNAAFGRLSRVIVLLLMPLSVLLAIAGPDVIAILFGRGKFAGEALRTTSLLFSVFILNLPLTGFMTIQTRYVVARQAIRYGVLWQIFSNALNFAIVWLCVRGLGVLGYPVGLFVHMLAYMLIITVPMIRRFPSIPFWPVWRSFAAAAVVSGIAAVPPLVFRSWAAPHLSPWSLGAATAAIYALGYGLMLLAWPYDRMAIRYVGQIALSLLGRLRTAAAKVRLPPGRRMR
jgi:putative peptidoglycan lipid II flippase